MKQQQQTMRRSRVPSTARIFVPVMVAIATMGANLPTDAFSPILPLKAVTSTMQHLSRGSGPITTKAMLVPPTTQISKPMKMDNESSSRGSCIIDDPTLIATTSPPVQIQQEEQETKSRSPTPFPFSMLRVIYQQIKSFQWVAVMAAFAFAFLPLQHANAAVSGGRMGGSFPSTATQPRQAISRPVRSSPSYNRGYSLSRPPVTIAPASRYGGNYGYYGSSFGIGSPLYSPFSTPARVYGRPGVLAVSRGPSFVDLLWVGGFLFVVSRVLSSDSFLESWKPDASRLVTSTDSVLGPGTSVVQLSVALEVPNRDDQRTSILAALDRLATTARTDSRVGIQNLTAGVALELLRRKSSIVSANAATEHFRDRSKALRDFDKRSFAERGKFETETVNKFGGVDYNSGRALLHGDGGGTTKNGDKSTMAVITVLLAIDGDSTKLPKISGISNVEQALQTIASDSKVGDCLQSAEILWTPEDRSETLSIRDVAADYPELRSV